jgi:uncharacterized protein YegP (UPF0339 family)
MCCAWQKRLLGLGLVVLLIAGTGQMLSVKAQEKKDKDGGAAGCVFELYKDSVDEYRFRLKKEDTILAVSGKGFKTKKEIQQVIDTIRKEGAKAKVEDQSKGAKKEKE